MRESSIHRMFEAGVILKGMHALLELVTGVAILAVSPVAVSNFFLALAQLEHSRGWPDFITNFLVRLSEGILRGEQHFAGIYLLAHGLINAGLVIGLLADAVWSYPISLAAIALFMAYQVYRYAYTRGIGLLLLTLYDAAVWWLVWHEYGVVRQTRRSEQVRFSDSGGVHRTP